MGAATGGRFLRLQHGLVALALGAGGGCAAWQQPGEPLGARLEEGGRYVHTASGRALYVEVRGEDRGRVPVLLVHGFASNHDVWDPLEPALRASRRTISVDLPGFGWSQRVEGDYSPAALARDLEDVLDAAGARQADVVAHSWGSSITLALALARPARVRRIVLIGAWIYDEQLPPAARWSRTPGVGEAIFTAFYRERPEDRFPAAFEDDAIVSQRLVEAIDRSLERPGTARAALAAIRGMCFLQQEGRYRTIQHPTLLLWGASDRVARPRFGERLAAEMPHATLAVVQRAGHFPMLEAPGRTRALVGDFLAAGDAAPQQSPP